MGAKREPQHKASRRYGMDLFGTGGASLQRRLNVPPGGNRPGVRRPTEYARQLREKQKVKDIYGVREAQFRRYVAEAQRSGAPLGRTLLEMLERRLDNVVYRLGLARTRLMARQMISHRHVQVDGDTVTVSSYLVSPGEKIALKADALAMPEVQEEMEARRPTVSWLRRDQEGGEVVDRPHREEIDLDINESLIVAFYTR
ncbi:MAG: 30S ribosomal protein S4 [Candidatus Manganitrophaceae bacterium]|nr:MAG: 30S ribosomal protein S4 [Candidatus Manganitrophaceae bacterium]